MSMVVCPSCSGARAGFSVACGHGCRPARFTCDFCKGEGEVSAEADERWHKGEGLRRARIERGLTLSEEAAILRVDPVVLNDIEHGRRSAEELNNRLLEELLQWPTIARDAGRKVKSEENWLRAHLWASTAVFHYRCFIALLKAEGAPAAEAATWKGDRHEASNK